MQNIPSTRTRWNTALDKTARLQTTVLLSEKRAGQKPKRGIENLSLQALLWSVVSRKHSVFCFCFSRSGPTPTIKSNSWGMHTFSVQQSVYSLVAPCRLPDLTSLALLGSVSGQPGLSRGPLPGYKRVSKWRLQLQDSIPFPLLSQRLCTTLHTSASLGCYLLFTHMPDCPLAPLTAVIYVLLGCKHWWCHNQFFPSFSFKGNYQTS